MRIENGASWVCEQVHMGRSGEGCGTIQGGLCGEERGIGFFWREIIMNPLVAQQVALDYALVAPDNHDVIGKCNIRIEPIKTRKEATYQVALYTLKLSPYYKAFLVTDDVPEIYMHQFWFRVSKINYFSSYRFKLDKKKFRIGVEVFMKFSRFALDSLIKSLFNHLLMKKSSRSSKKLEDFMYQIDNRQTTAARHSNMPYPRFTKAIIQHFISKDKTISIRNNLFMHSIKDDNVLEVLKFISKYEENQVYGKPIPDVIMSKEIMDTTTYNTYLAFATGKAIPKKARKNTKAHITLMKESSLTTDDNIISEDPNVSLELAKSISSTEAEEQEAARLVHETRECSSEGVCLKPEVPDKPKVNFVATNISEESWGNDSDTGKSDEEEVPWIYSESDNKDQAIDDVKKNDEAKVEKEKDTEQEPIQDEQAKDEESPNAEITSMVDAQIQQEIPFVLSAPLLDVLAFVVPPTPTNPTPLPIPTSSTITTTKDPTSTSMNPKFKTLSALQHKVSNSEKEVTELKQVDLSTTLQKPPLSFDDLMSTPIDFSAFATNHLKISRLTKVDLVGPIYNLLKGTRKSCVELEYNMEECYRALSDQLVWNNLEDNRCPYDLNKPLHLHESRGRRIVPSDFFFNNDLEYLRGGSTYIKYTASTTKIKAAKHDVCVTIRILSASSVSVDKWLNDLEGNVIVDLVVALCMYSRRIVLQKRVEDHQQGVESDQKKLNISKPQIRDVDLSCISLYTTLSEPQGVIYKDKMKRKRLMRTEELYKFSDGKLTSVITLWIIC
uniref:Uncharacterized protein n=1 Tax=Tanacetum cinerariifolium TaxID=118510 RepID=A0A6L2NMH8_TANCI|nr:hypothetical protein [Tanacetum cinerariifolium]